MRIEGELTIYTVAERKAEVLDAFGATDAAAVDLSGVTEIDGAGVQLLMVAQDVARRRGHAVAWTNPSSAAAEALAVAGTFSGRAG